MKNDFRDAALVLVGHGSTKSAESAAPVYQHANELRRRGIFGQVLEGFWKIEPRVADVVRGATAARVFVVPLFTSEGYFTQEAIPRELGLDTAGPRSAVRIQRRTTQTPKLQDKILYYCAPVGTHPGMTDILLARARQVVEEHPFPRAPKPVEISLFIVGHGTLQNKNSRAAVEKHADLIRQRGDYAQVESLFLEEEPRVPKCYQLAQTRNIVIVPFFISDGMHSWEDIPELLGEPRKTVRERLGDNQPPWRNPTERNGKLVWYSNSVGTDPLVADVILKRVDEASQFAP